MIICIDPGHSGDYEPGAVRGIYKEAALTLKIAHHVKSHLEAFGYDVVMTRTDEIDNDLLQPRVDTANAAAADVFVSIHINAAINEQASGFEIYHYPSSRLGNSLAVNVQRSLIRVVNLPDRGIKTAGWYVLRYTNMPAIMVECGFLSNPVDRMYVASSQGQWYFGEAIAHGIHCYCRMNCNNGKQ